MPRFLKDLYPCAGGCGAMIQVRSRADVPRAHCPECGERKRLLSVIGYGLWRRQQLFEKVNRKAELRELLIGMIEATEESLQAARRALEYKPLTGQHAHVMVRNARVYFRWALKVAEQLPSFLDELVEETPPTLQLVKPFKPTVVAHIAQDDDGFEPAEVPDRPPPQLRLVRKEESL